MRALAMSPTVEQAVLDLIDQPSYAKSLDVDRAVEVLAAQGGIEERGAVFTRREVVEFILDLLGYESERPLHRLSILEPSFGGGDFLIPIVERLLVSCRSLLKAHANPISLLADAIRAVELHRETFVETRGQVMDLLIRNGIGAESAAALCDHWMVQGDFMLQDWDRRFDVVAVNPPYVRRELIPAPLLEAYRRRFRTMYDRADIYVMLPD